MIKTYTSKTCVSISVKIGGKGCHLAFTPKTLGGSSYTTDDPAVQTAIESHWRFGKTIQVEAPKVEKPKVKEETVPAGPREVKVSSLAEAKELVVEKTGLSRSKLRSKADIEQAAAGAGIKLVFSE